MQPVIEQATHALQLGRFETAKTLASGALIENDIADTRLPLLEVLAQAQAGLQEHEAAAGAWQDAYRHATEPDDKTRLFEQARQAIRDQQDYPTLLQLAQDHLPHSRTPQEQAACMLAAGEALVQLQRYAEARQQYLEPALELTGVNPETRLHLWHYLGLAHLAEQTFTEAAVAFRQSADLALGQHFASSAPHLAAQRTQLHHLRNAARFYEGVIHLIYQRPEHAIQSFQELQRPLTAAGALNLSLFLGLAYRMLQQPEAAARALQSLTRGATSLETLRGPAAVVRAGIATLQDPPAALGEPFEAAVEGPLQARTSWEPSWAALLYRELGLAFQRLSCRDAAIVCYEEGLKAVVQRLGIWAEEERHDDLRGAALLATLAELPLETWSAVAQSEVGHLLQGLAWLAVQTQEPGVADQAFALALRVATTPEQEAVIWCQRGWCQVMTPPAPEHGPSATSLSTSALIEGLQAAKVQCTESAVGRVAEAMLALLQGQPDQASTLFAQGLQVPAFAELHVLCHAAWFWAHTRNGTLAQALAPTQSALPWQTPMVLARALEMFMMTPEQAHAPLAWLPVLLTQQPTPTLEALRLLCRPGYLPASQDAQVLTELRRLCTQLTDTTVSDQIVVLLGGPALVERIEALLATLDQLLMTAASTSQAGRQRGKQRQGRGATPAAHIAAETAHILQLLNLWHNTPQALDKSVPELVLRWLQQYTQLSAQAPEVVGALLGLFRQCPGAAAVIPTLLEHVTLSRRQRQAMEAALLTPAEGAATTSALFSWEDLHAAPLGRIFEALADLQRPAGPEFEAVLAARGHYLAALVFARMQLLSHAVASLQTCLQHQPEHPLAHYTMAKLQQGQGQHEAALQHMQQAWQGLQSLAVPPQVLHLEILNQLMTLLDITHQQAQLSQWLTAFEEAAAAVRTLPLNAEQQQHARAEEGVGALRHANHLAVTSPLAGAGVVSTAPQQLAYLEQAIDCGALDTRHSALHRQAELFARLYRYDDALAVYADMLQHWPDDQRAQQRLALLTAVCTPASDPASTDRLLAEALTLACAEVEAFAPSAPLTPDSVLAWLPQAPALTPVVLGLVDLLTLYGSVAVQRQEWQRALQLLTPLYTAWAQPRQAYLLAVTYYARSQRAAGAEALQASERALQYAQEALQADPTLTEATALLQQIETNRQTLMTMQHQEQGRSAYRQRISHLFGQHGVRIQATTVPGTANAPWVVMREMADLDDATGMLVTTVQLAFNSQAMGLEAVPDDAEVTLYAQHQRDKQRVVDVHGIEALPWPHTAYEGQMDFAALFPERLGLNRDVLFVAFADVHALLRYARVLQYIVQEFVSAPVPVVTLPPGRLAAAARYLTVVPLLQQRLQMLAASAPSKAVQRQINAVCETFDIGMTPETFQHSTAFMDAYTYFRAIVDTVRAHLETPSAERPDVQQHEERQPTRPARRKRRPSKDRWREGEPERRRESYISDTL